MFNSIHGIQMLQNRILKRSAFVAMYSSRYSIDVEQFVHYYLCSGNGLLIWCYKCLIESRKGISQDQDIFLTIPWWIHDGKIHTKKVQWSISHNKSRSYFRTYLGTFGHLTSWTMLNILSYICIHSIPVEVLSAQGCGSFYPLMTLAIVQHLKHLCLIF